jgi:hypothetical protein
MGNSQQFIKIDAEIQRAREAFRANPELKQLKANLDELVAVREAIIDEIAKPLRDETH